MTKMIHASGKRKRSVARASLKSGKGVVKVNNVPLDFLQPKLSRMKIREPLILAGELANKVDISVNVQSGGISGQADAARLAIAKALVEYTKSDRLKDQFLKYSRTLLVADVRRKESCKPNDSKARAKRQKSYR